MPKGKGTVRSYCIPPGEIPALRSTEQHKLDLQVRIAKSLIGSFDVYYIFLKNSFF